MQCPLNVEGLTTEAIAAEGNPTPMPAYEEVDLEPCIGLAVERTVITAGDTCTSSDDKYSALIMSDVTSLKPHNYETVKLPIMADYVNTLNASQQNNPNDFTMKCSTDYVNI